MRCVVGVSYGALNVALDESLVYCLLASIRTFVISSSKLAPGQLKVVKHQPWRGPVIMFATIAIGLTCLLIGFAMGQNKAISGRVSNSLLSQDLNEAQERADALEAELVDARLQANVQAEASNTLREDLTSAHEKAARLTEEVAFYKGLMSPSSLARGLQVAELELTPGAEPGQYAYQLLLTQVALRRSYISGEVRVDIIGHYGDAVVGDAAAGDAVEAGDGQDGAAENGEAVLSLTELTALNTYPLKFRFRYFQDLTGQLTLPAGYVPDRVLVTANQSGKEALQVTFGWPEL